jgi:NADPH:quinone reductase-like Zn-dependent oxidoreductase
MTEMPAIAIDDFGTRPALHELPRPEPAEGEVLVRVQASSINGFDVAVSRGTIGDMPYEFPIILGRDFAGTVEAVGAGVTGFELGGRVFGVNMKPRLGKPLHDGTFAEFTSVPAEFVATIPDQVTNEAAGALGLAGSAAHAAVDAVALGAGATVLVSGATGGVGAFAVQLAKARGATVIATATHEFSEYVTELGADETVDHTDDLAAAVHSSHPDGVDAIVHLAGDIHALAGLLKPGGRAASTLAVDGRVRAAAVTRVNATLERPAFESLVASVDEGRLIVPIRATYALADVPTALDDFTRGSHGKLSIRIPRPV